MQNKELGRRNHNVRHRHCFALIKNRVKLCMAVQCILISGKVNAGDRYNDEESFIREIEKVYSIVKIDYLYNYLENHFEAPFLFILNNLNKNKKGVIARILKSACYSERRAEMVNLLTRKIYGEKGKTHIFILC